MFSRFWYGAMALSAAALLTSVVMAADDDTAMPKDDQRHVIVVGGGLAGLTAVIEAVSNGARVTLIEGEADTGGNSAKASSGINGCGTTAQKEANIQDSIELFVSDTMKAGHQKNKRDLVDALVRKSAEAVKFLIDFGTDLSEINLLGGQSVPRTHWIPSPKEGKPKPVGMTIMKELKSQIIAMLQLFGSETIQILTKTKALRLITSDDIEAGRVIGVEAQIAGDDETEKEKIERIIGDAVILTTGGFSNDRDGLLHEFAPASIAYPTTNGAFARGDGVKMARAIGAKLIDMDKVQLHPTGFVDPKAPKAYTKFLAAEALRGMGGLLLNQGGHRFANELGTRDYLTGKILEKCELNETSGGHTAYLIMNDRTVDKFGWPAFNFYWKVKGFFQKVENVDEFAAITGVQGGNVVKAFSNYAASTAAGKDEFDKTVFYVQFQPDEPFYFATITPSIHYTMGGLEIDARARVLRASDDAPIAGLYAAGEVTGGVHGDNRLGGNSLLECVVFGRIAAANAAAEETDQEAGTAGKGKEEL